MTCCQIWAQSKKEFERLDGVWDLYIGKNPYQAFDCINNGIAADYKSEVPGYWNKDLPEGSDPKTYGCYRYVCKGLDPQKKYALLVQDAPKTSCSVFVNRKKLVTLGDPFLMASSDYDPQSRLSHSQVKPIYCEFYPDQEGNAELIFFISNYFYRKGGLCDSVLFGKAKEIERLDTIYTIFYTIVFGCLLFITLLNIVQFFINHKRLEYLYLAISAFMFALRIVTAGYCSLAIIFPGLTAEVKVKLEYMVLWIAPPATLQMVFAMYPTRKKHIWEIALRYVVITCVLALGIVSLILPAVYSNQLVPILQLAMGLVCFYVVIVCIVNIASRKRYSLLHFLSFFIIIIGAIVDILYTRNRSLLPLALFPFFLVIYLLIQVLLIGVIQNDLYQQTLKKSAELKLYNEAYLRFVPQEFLNLLNKESIINTKLGDFSNIEMCIMFSKLTIDCQGHEGDLQQHFQIFNEYLKEVSPIISKHKGFVSKFLSGGFMALFPQSQLDAVGAAFEIKNCTREFNKKEICKEHKLESWIGIHYGKMIIGTIGEENRLDDTVISDTVNTSARIEAVCEKLKKNIIISRSLNELAAKDLRLKLAEKGIPMFTIEPLEAIFVKGKEKPLQLYELLEKDSIKRGGQE